MIDRHCHKLELVAAYCDLAETYFVRNLLWGLDHDNISEVWVVAGVEESYRSLGLGNCRSIALSNSCLVDQSVRFRLWVAIVRALVTQDEQTSDFLDLDFV